MFCIGGDKQARILSSGFQGSLCLHEGRKEKQLCFTSILKIARDCFLKTPLRLGKFSIFLFLNAGNEHSQTIRPLVGDTILSNMMRYLLQIVLCLNYSLDTVYKVLYSIWRLPRDIYSSDINRRIYGVGKFQQPSSNTN